MNVIQGVFLHLRISPYLRGYWSALSRTNAPKAPRCDACAPRSSGSGGWVGEYDRHTDRQRQTEREGGREGETHREEAETGVCTWLS